MIRRLNAIKFSRLRN